MIDHTGLVSAANSSECSEIMVEGGLLQEHDHGFDVVNRTHRPRFAVPTVISFNNENAYERHPEQRQTASGRGGSSRDVEYARILGAVREKSRAPPC